jgi:hypothetical protein
MIYLFVILENNWARVRAWHRKLASVVQPNANFSGTRAEYEYRDWNFWTVSLLAFGRALWTN